MYPTTNMQRYDVSQQEFKRLDGLGSPALGTRQTGLLAQNEIDLWRRGLTAHKPSGRPSVASLRSRSSASTPFNTSQKVP